MESEGFLAWRAVGAEQKVRNILTLCQGRQFESLVEIGCGTGEITRRLAETKLARSYFATDLSFSAVRFSYDHSGGHPVPGVVAGVASLPFAHDTFALAVLSHVLEHLPDPARAAREASQVARHLLIEVPTERVLSCFLRHWVKRKPRTLNATGHIQFWSPRSIERFLENECRLRIISRRRDLIAGKAERWGKKGLRRIVLLVKGLFKSVLPAGICVWLFTTHVAFLCQRIPNPSDTERGKSRATIH